MQITRFSDFSLRVLMYLSVLDREQLATITELANRFQISRNHLIKVVNQLAKLGWIETIRGRNGGFKLAISPEQLKLGQILKAVEPNQTLIDCQKSACNLRGVCLLKGFLDEGLDALYQQLDQYTLADTVQSPTQERLQTLHLLPTDRSNVVS